MGRSWGSIWWSAAPVIVSACAAGVDPSLTVANGDAGGNDAVARPDSGAVGRFDAPPPTRDGASGTARDRPLVDTAASVDVPAPEDGALPTADASTVDAPASDDTLTPADTGLAETDARASCEIVPLGSVVGTGVASGSTVGRSGLLDTAACGVPAGHVRGGTDAAEVVYRWTAPRTGTYVFDTAGSAFNTLLYLREGTCDGRDLACNDDIGTPPSAIQSSISVGLAAGQRGAVSGCSRRREPRGTSHIRELCKLWRIRARRAGALERLSPAENYAAGAARSAARCEFRIFAADCARSATRRRVTMTCGTPSMSATTLYETRLRVTR